MKKAISKRRGFTLIEILVVIGIIAVLAGVVLVAINPARQFAQARNSQRTSNVAAVLNAISQRIADNRGLFEQDCPAGVIPTASTTMSKTTFDIGPCLVPTYMSAMPFDPSLTGAHYTNIADYDTKYSIVKDAVTGRITVSASGAELDQIITVTR